MLEATKTEIEHTIFTSKSSKDNGQQQFLSHTIMEAQTAVHITDMQQLAQQNDDWKVQQRMQSSRFVVGGNNGETIEIKNN